MRTLSAAVIAIAISVVACGGDNTPTTSPTPGATATVSPSTTSTASTLKTATATPPSRLPSDTPTAPPSPTPSPTPVVTEVPGPSLDISSPSRIIYTSARSIDGSTSGPLRIADLAGHSAPLSPDDVSASFVGLIGDPLTVPATVYYIAGATDDSAIIYRRQLPDGTAERIAHISPWFSRTATGDLSPDGRYIAYTDQYGIEILDLQTQEFRLAAASGGDKDKCNNPVPGQPGGLGACTAFNSPQWSPNGKLLSVAKGYYEGGDHWVFDPFTPGSSPIPAGHCCGGQWSPTSDAVCSWGDYGGYTPLFVTRGPSWIEETHGQTSDDYQDPDRLQVEGCSWLDDHRVAVVVIPNTSYPTPPSSWTEIIDLTTDARIQIGAKSLGEQCCGRTVYTVPDAGLVLAQYFISNANSNTSEPTKPAAIDVATGQAYSLLQPGDWIVTVVTP